MTRRTMAILLLVLSGGCGFFSRSQSRFYSLERLAAPGEVTAAIGPPVGIDVVELPPGLDRRDIVVRQPDHRLEVREREQWTALLEPLVLHTLAFDLASRLPRGMMILPGQTRPDRGMRSLDVLFEELAAGPDRVVHLDARWSVRASGSAQPVLAGHEKIAIEIPTLDSPNIANGMSQALAELSDRIAAHLLER